MKEMLNTVLSFAAAAKPAGGAAAGEVIGATTAALVLTGVVLTLGIAHRAGRTQLLKRAAEQAARVSGGLPTWAALPVGFATTSLLIAVFGMYWDISLHIDQGRDPGPLANPAHYFILAGLFGIFVAGFLAIVLPEPGEKPSRSAVRIADGWYAPVGGVVLMACASFALLGFPLDDVWHRLFGQDVTLWGPTHMMMIGGAGLSLLGHATLLAEAGRTARPQGLKVRGLWSFVHRTRYAGIFGGLLIGLSTFQGEFDFGVPQFQLIFHPLLIAFAAGVALVGARIYTGRGGALVAVGYFFAIRGLVSILVGPVAGEATPHFPLWIAEAACVELVALWLGTARSYRFGALSGVLIGTVGLAAEWGWSHVWMPIPWPSSMIGEAIVITPLVAVGGGLVGAFVGTALAAPLRKLPSPAPAIAPAAVGLLILALAVGFGLHKDEQRGVRASVAVHQTTPPPNRQGNLTVRFDPRSAPKDAKWLNVTAWQGGGLVVKALEKAGPDTWRTPSPVPLHGDWKALIRLHKGSAIDGVPVYLPADPAIPVKGVPARPRFERAVVPDVQILQRERKKDVSPSLFKIAALVVLGIALFLVTVIGWALARVARFASDETPPREQPRAQPARPRPAVTA
jgi:hypothetical protein